MIQVCDAIMGTGKSSAAITYMNEHPDDKFIYVTPYLEEAARIKNSCPEMRFVEPSEKIPEYHFKKCEHTAALIKQGRNITTTHQAFKRYTEEMLNDIKDGGYCLMIDENLDMLERYEIHQDDVQMAIDAGLIKLEDDTYRISRTDYKGTMMRELLKFLEVRDLIRLNEDGFEKLFYWVLPPNLLTSFKNVIIMTYLFKGQSLHHMLEMYKLQYEYIGIEKTGDHQYRFCDYPGYTPEYVSEIKDMIHVIDNQKMNAIGRDRYALSMNWFAREDTDVEQLKRNISNCINNIWRDVPADKKLWGTYNGEYGVIKDKGYTKSFLTFNARATNAYKERTHLVYIANLFMNVGDKRFYCNHGVEVDDDMYALSTMVQWIWRSAIRDGKEIFIYIPSRRMRELLIDWINRVSKEGNNIAV